MIRSADSPTQKHAELLEMRRKHGFVRYDETPFRRRQSAKRWSRGMLATLGEEGYGELPRQLPSAEQLLGGRIVTKNALIYQAIQEKFSSFAWEYRQVSRPRYGISTVVVFHNYPTVGGKRPTLFDLLVMPSELADHALYHSINHHTEMAGMSGPIEQIRTDVAASGFGYKGIDGLSWLPAFGPIKLPCYLEKELLELGRALFTFFSVVADLYRKEDRWVRDLLSHKVPLNIVRLMEEGTVDVIRPDIVLTEVGGRLQFVLTELETCPGGQGMGYSVEKAYGLAETSVSSFVEYLAGRPYRVVATHQWAEYTWELATFCQALREKGVDAEVLFDTFLDQIHTQVADSWIIPPGAPLHVRQEWNTDFLGRIARLGLGKVVRGAEYLGDIPQNAVVYRFGYFDNFGRDVLTFLKKCQDKGAVVINPLQFMLESKSLMAAIGISSVREIIGRRIGSEGVAILDRCVAETRLLTSDEDLLAELYRDRGYWLTKFAAWDGSNRSWGSRSLEVGSYMSDVDWQRSLSERLDLGFPVVAQHTISSVRYNIAYTGVDGRVAVLPDARTRFTPFLYRGKDGQILYGGGLMTLRSNTFRVHGATDAVEAPVIFQD